MHRFIRPLKARDSQEHHRVSTTLELLFDLVTVIAIAAAAAGLHHGIAHNHTMQALALFVMAFFSIWWAWMNYTWFASSYDNNDTLFRLFTLLIMSGSLCIASGIGALFSAGDFTYLLIGYLIMRLGMIAFWLRAAQHDPARRATAITYAVGIFIAQAFWVGFYLLKLQGLGLVFAAFSLCAAIELSVPYLAERQAHTPWHRHHIMERYGLLNIIVLGETLLSASRAMQQLVNGANNIAFFHIALAAMTIGFSMWWLYFAQEEHFQDSDTGNTKRMFIWGYGHFLIFAAGAGVGAGIAVLVDVVAGNAEISLHMGDLAVASPVALYMLGLWLVRDRYCLQGAARWTLPVFALLVLLVTFTPIALEGIALLTALSVGVRSYLARKNSASAQT